MLQLHNTMTRGTQPFEPREGGLKVKMFSCGPSIYRRPHVGNYRTFIWEDAVQRYLEYLGYEVHRALNFTDIEDKAISEAVANGRSVRELTGAVAERFFEEARSLEIKLPDPIPRSSTSVEQAVELILQLLDKGVAYWNRGDVFFDPLKYKEFGKLFRLDMSKWPDKKKRFRLDTYPGQRWNLGDFVLWHGHGEGDPVFWETKIGKGRPSWNIQDPAMISQTLGFTLDIFCGGVDNLYRHHDYNIAVMESISGRELSRYWLHGEHVLVRGKKMSKSLDNIVYIEDLLAPDRSPKHIRFYLLSTHYRKRISLSGDSFQKSCAGLDRLRSLAGDLLGRPSGEKPAGFTPPMGATGAANSSNASKYVEEIGSRFESAMNDDLDSSKAIEGVTSSLKNLHRLWNAGGIGPDQAAQIERKLRNIDKVFQFIF